MVGLLITHSHKFHENGGLHFIYYFEVQPLQMILVGVVNYIDKYWHLASQYQPLYITEFHNLMNILPET